MREPRPAGPTAVRDHRRDGERAAAADRRTRSVGHGGGDRCRLRCVGLCTAGRFDAAAAYVSRTVGAHGYLGVEMLDRTTGAVWRDGATTHEGWTASTIKLAIAADLLTRARAGWSRSPRPTGTTWTRC
ncbi:hypothetical protein ACFQV8_14365 [Pseudonocardia benzenivorans]